MKMQNFFVTDDKQRNSIFSYALDEQRFDIFPYQISFKPGYIIYLMHIHILMAWKSESLLSVCGTAFSSFYYRQIKEAT